MIYKFLIKSFKIMIMSIIFNKFMSYCILNQLGCLGGVVK